MGESGVDLDRRIQIELSVADALVLFESLRRYAESEPQVFRPNASEYSALMHVLGGVERAWLEETISPEQWRPAVAEAYEALGDPAGYRGSEPSGLPQQPDPQ